MGFETAATAAIACVGAAIADVVWTCAIRTVMGFETAATAAIACAGAGPASAVVSAGFAGLSLSGSRDVGNAIALGAGVALALDCGTITCAAAVACGFASSNFSDAIVSFRAVTRSTFCAWMLIWDWGKG